MNGQVKRGTPASADLRDRAQALVEEHGERLAAKMLKINRGTLARVLGGLPVQEGTMSLLRERFGESS